MAGSGKNIITEGTLVPLSLVAIVAGGIFWLSTLYAEVKANTDGLSRIEERSDKYLTTVEDINKRLSRIEGKLDRRR